MHDDAHQGELGSGAAGAPKAIHRTGLKAVCGLAGVIALAVTVAVSGGLPGLSASSEMIDDTHSLPTAAQQRVISELTVDDEEQILVEGSDAAQRNAEVPLSQLALQTVGSFSLGKASLSNQSTALKCMAQAIYYEAAHEPVEGKRAVAQVILNRLRHKAYPSSVCSVVYQGSSRRTGCQFSFTCDGSLLRKPMAKPWREAKAVARQALAGKVENSVGTATHYHADYVLPKWAFQLGKIGKHGRHIFYRFNGGWGRSASFKGRYSGIERIPAINLAALENRADQERLQGHVPGLTVVPHVTDRHAATDVGGRLDTTKQWRLAIPDPTQASEKYAQAVASTKQNARQPATSPPQKVALAEADSQAMAP